MARLDPAIRHAITPPEFGENMLHREHLVDRLHGEIPRSLVAIAAPAGYGKSTLLADFTHHTELPVCWVRVSDADRDLMRLASVFLASLETRFRRLRDKLDLRAFAGSSPLSVARAFHALVEDSIQETFVIAFDDIHLIHSSVHVREFLDELILGLPENATVFAAGREVLEISLARLMAEGRLSGLGPHDLALNREEAVHLTTLKWQNPPGEHELDSLLTRTRGWVTGVLLSEQSEASIDLAGGLPENLAYEYLATVVLNRLPERMRRFLLEASVLPHMTSETCDELLDRDDSEELLSLAASMNLFLTETVETPIIYKFHPMFRDLLNQTLEASDPMRYDKLRLKAADSLEGQSPELAIQLLIQLGDMARAASIVELLAPKYYRLGRFESLRQWHEELAENSELLPNLTYYLALSNSDQGNFEEALAVISSHGWSEETRPSLHAKVNILRAFILLRSGHLTSSDLDSAISKATALTNQVIDPVPHALLCWLKATFALLSRGDVDTHAKFIEEAIKYAEEANDEFLLSSILPERVRILALNGELNQADIAARRALQLSEQIGSPSLKATTTNDLAQNELMRGNYELALGLFDEASSLARLAASDPLEALSHYGKAEVFADLGLSIQAAQHYSEGLELAGRCNHKNLIKAGCLGTSILHRRAGNFSLAKDWIERASSISNEYMATVQEIEKAALIAHSRPDRAANILKTAVADTDRDAVEETRRLFWLAYSEYRLDHSPSSTAVFREALELSSLNSTAQTIAAELISEPEYYRFVSDQFEGDPSFSIPYDLAEKMLAFQRHYGVDGRQEEESSLRVHALGGVELFCEGNPVRELKPQALEFFLYLLDGGAVDKDRAGEEFWPEHPPGRQTANLHMAVYSIRKALGKGVVRLDGNAYRLSAASTIEYDVRKFERAVNVVRRLPTADPRRLFALTEAVNSYSGPFMPEYFSNWVQERRTQLELDYLDVTSELAEEAIRRDEPRRALGHLRQALNVDPYREDLNLNYLHLLQRLNRRTDIISHYRRYAELLRRDFELEPAEAATKVHKWAIGEGRES